MLIVTSQKKEILHDIINKSPKWYHFFLPQSMRYRHHKKYQASLIDFYSSFPEFVHKTPYDVIFIFLIGILCCFYLILMSSKLKEEEKKAYFLLSILFFSIFNSLFFKRKPDEIKQFALQNLRR